jgi:hypothetical protein
VETLPSTLCAVIPKASAALVAPVFIKGSASATIYQLTNGTRVTMTSGAQMTALAAPNTPVWQTMTDAFVTSIPRPSS